MAKQTKPVVEVELGAAGARATVTLDGKPIEAEVQLWPGTPWRHAPAGEINIPSLDPESMLTRRKPLGPCVILARAKGSDVESEPVRVEIGEVR